MNEHDLTAPAPTTRTRRRAWLLAVLAAALVAAATFAGHWSRSYNYPSGSPRVAASSDDRFPVRFITEDPTCVRFFHLAMREPTDVATYNVGRVTLSDAVTGDSSRQEARDVSRAMAELSLDTPHRVMRELYEQFVAYFNEGWQVRHNGGSGVGYFHAAEQFARTIYTACLSTYVDLPSPAFGIAHTVTVKVTDPPVLTPQDPNTFNPDRFLSSDASVCQRIGDTPEGGSAIPAIRAARDSSPVMEDLVDLAEFYTKTYNAIPDTRKNSINSIIDGMWNQVAAVVVRACFVNNKP